MRFERLVDAIGQTPLVRLSADARDVQIYAKLELQNLFAMKDRVAKHVITEAKKAGELSDSAPIIESSSGTMALGLALIGTALGHPVHIVTDPRIDPITHTKLIGLGCHVHVVAKMTSQGWQSARLELLRKLQADLPGAFWPRQYSNPQNPAAYHALAAELRADLGTFDVLVGSVGSGGSLCGTSRALKGEQPNLRVVAVDCVGSVLFAQPDRPQRKQSGLGNSIQPANIDYSLIDEVHWLSDDEAFEATRRLAMEQKVFAGNTSGSVYQVLTHLAANAEPGTTLVGIFPDRGDRYVESVYLATLGPVSLKPTLVTYGEPVESWSYALLGKYRRPLLFVESNTTGTGMAALRMAARLGVRPVLLTNKPSRYAGPGELSCDVVECVTDDPVSLRATVERQFSGVRPVGVVTTCEYYLVAAASLACDLSLPGNHPEAMATCRNKVRTREVLSLAGMAQPRFWTVTEVAAVDSAVAHVGLPCVVKPIDESGSTNVLLCHSVTEAASHVAALLAVTNNSRGQSAPRAALLEEFLPQPELSVETFSMDGSSTCIGITEKVVTAGPHFVETQHIFPAPLPPAVAREVAYAAEKALQATGVELGASHVEVKLTSDGPVIVEINARPAGGMIPEVVRLATGVDLIEQQLRAALGLPIDLTPVRARYAGIRFLLAPQVGVLHAVHGLQEAQRVVGVHRIEITAGVGDCLQSARSFADRLGYLIAVGESYGQTAGALHAAAERITFEVET